MHQQQQQREREVCDDLRRQYFSPYHQILQVSLAIQYFNGISNICGTIPLNVEMTMGCADVNP